MTKNSILNRGREHQDDDEVFNFMDDMDDDELNTIEPVDLMAGVVEAGKNQMMFALELTKIAVKHNARKDLSTEEIFSIFKQATVLIDDSNPMKPFLDDVLKKT